MWRWPDHLIISFRLPHSWQESQLPGELSIKTQENKDGRNKCSVLHHCRWDSSFLPYTPGLSPLPAIGTTDFLPETFTPAQPLFCTTEQALPFPFLFRQWLSPTMEEVPCLAKHFTFPNPRHHPAFSQRFWLVINCNHFRQGILHVITKGTEALQGVTFWISFPSKPPISHHASSTGFRPLHPYTKSLP